jgi:hypothetical protein
MSAGDPAPARETPKIINAENNAAAEANLLFPRCPVLSLVIFAIRRAFRPEAYSPFSNSL